MLKLMRAPAKYVQGEDALLELCQNVENLGKSFLFICSGSGRKATEDKIRQSFASSEAQIYLDVYKRQEHIVIELGEFGSQISQTVPARRLLNHRAASSLQ